MYLSYKYSYSILLEQKYLYFTHIYTKNFQHFNNSIVFMILLVNYIILLMTIISVNYKI